MRTSCIFLLTILFRSTDGLNIQKNQEIVSSGLGEEASPVFYLVVMGKLAYRHQVSTWLSSLRVIGGWKGEVVIITDKPACLEKTLAEAKLLGNQLNSDDNVNIYAPASGQEGNIHVIKRPTTKNVLKMKLEKARAWLNIQTAKIPHPVSAIVYTDEDVVIGKDLTNFLRDVKYLGMQKPPATLALFKDTGVSKGELHTGIVVMFPGAHTDACLQAWGKKLTHVQIGSAIPADSEPVATTAKLIAEEDVEEAEEEGGLQEDQLSKEEILAMGPDQKALGATKTCKRAKDGSHDGIKILSKSYFYLPTSSGLKKMKRFEFVHFTNTGRWKLISHNTIKQYLYKIGIPKHIDPMGRVQDKTCQDQ